MHAECRLARRYRLLRNSWRAFVRFCNTRSVSKRFRNMVQPARQPTSGSVHPENPQGMPLSSAQLLEMHVACRY